MNKLSLSLARADLEISACSGMVNSWRLAKAELGLVLES